MSVEFIFLFSPNNSGSTIIGQYLESQTGGFLPPYGNYEGQAAPGVSDEMQAKKWKTDQQMDWPRIRAYWSGLAQDAGKPLFIECSPPNIVRVEEIRAAFGENMRGLFSITSPYNYLASTLFNYQRPPAPKKQVNSSVIKRRIDRWVLRANSLRKSILANPELPRITYEGFCADPGCVNEALGIERQSVTKLKGKANDPVTEIVDLTARNYAFLTFSEWDRANACLEPHQELLEFFGYGTIPGQKMLEISARDPALFHAGLARRAQWYCSRKSQKRR